jgi:hypothetical protein
MVTEVTVKATNFGHHGDFGSCLASFVAFLDESCNKNEQNRISKSKGYTRLHFSEGRVLMIASPSEKEELKRVLQKNDEN